MGHSLSNVLPGFAMHNPTHDCSRNRKSSRNGRLRDSRLAEETNLADRIVRNLGGRVALAPRPRLNPAAATSAFLGRIPHIVLSGSAEKVDGPEARPVVAMVTNVKAFRNRAVADFVSEPVGAEHFVSAVHGDAHRSVAFLLAACPIQARVGRPRLRRIVRKFREFLFQEPKIGSLVTHVAAIQSLNPTTG